MVLSVSVRQDILTSWQRCVIAGLRPDHFEVLYQPDLDDDGPLRWAAAPILDQVADELEGTGGLTPGFLYGEGLIGTNAIGTAIAKQAPSVVTGTEHFADALTPMACAAIPASD